MDDAEGLERLKAARVGVLGTVRLDGSPHLVPVVFATDRDTLVTAVDHKPKATTNLQRLTNIRANPHGSLLTHGYSEDWESLWWVRVDGRAEIIQEGSDHQAAIGRLQAKYPQYANRPPTGAVIRLAIDRLATWAGAGE